MAYDVEDKVVQMRFDNRDFDPNIDASIKSLEHLEKSLKLANGTKGFEDVEKKAKNFNLDPAINSIEVLTKSFSSLEIAGITAISNIANRLTNISLSTLKSIFITPISTGWQEYGMQMDSTQVIMANTGEQIGRVTEHLNELNDYADLTIYSFNQMTQAIGKFAAASVDLDSSVSAIKGLSNAAALVGANNQNLYSAYYNLSQALQLGALTAIDWRPLQYSMIGTRTMQKVFIETAISLGKFTRESEQAKKAFTDFKGSLSSRWLDKDVIVNGLKVYSLNFEELTKQIDSATGEIYYLNKAGEKIPEWMAKLGDSATRSATEIRNLKQLWDVIREEAQTGWSANWKIIVGDLNEAKQLWTNVGNRIRSILDAINEKLKDVLTFWQKNDGRNLLINVINISLNNLRNGLVIFYSVLDKILPISTSLFIDLTQKINNMSEAFQLSSEQIEKTIKVLTIITTPIRVLVRFLMILGTITRSIVSIILDFSKIVYDLVSYYVKLLSNIFDNVRNILKVIFPTLITIEKFVKNILSGSLNIIYGLYNAIAPIILSIWALFKTVFSLVIDIIKNLFNKNILVIISNLLNTVYIILHLISYALVGILNIINEFLKDGGSDFIASLITLLGSLLYAISKIGLVVAYVAFSIFERISPLLGSITRLLTSILNLVLRFLSVIFNKDFSSIDDLLVSFVYLMSKVIDKFSEFVLKASTVITSITENIKNSDLFSIGEWIVKSIVNGITSTMPKLFAGLISMGNTIINTIRNILQIHSMSPLFFDIGAWIPKSIALAEEKGLSEVKNASKNLTKGILWVFENSNNFDRAEKQLESWNYALEKFAYTMSKTAIPRLILAGIALLGLITIIIIMIDRMPKVGAIFDLIDNIGDSLMIRSIGQALRDFGETLLLISLSFILLRIAVNNMSNVDFARVMSMFISINAVILILTIISKTLTSIGWSGTGKLAAFQLFIRSITISLMMLISSLVILSFTKINAGTNMALQSILASVLILTGISAIIATKASSFLKSLGGIVIIDLVIIALIAILRELSSIAYMKFSANSVSKILGSVTSFILFMAFMSRFIIRNERDIGKAMLGMLVIHSSTLAIVALIRVLAFVGKKKFDGQGITNTLLGVFLCITLYTIMARIIISNIKDIGRSMVGMGLLHASTLAMVPLILSLSELGNTNYSAEDLIWIIGALTISVAFLAKFTTFLYNNTVKTKAVLLAIINVISTTSAIGMLIKRLKDIEDKNINVWKLAGILFVVEGAIAGLAAITTRIVGGKFKDMPELLSGLIVTLFIIASFIRILKTISKFSVIPDFNIIFESCAFAILSISWLVVLASKIIPTESDIAKAAVGTASLVAITYSIISIMKQIKKLNGIDVSYKTIDQLLMLETFIGILSLLAIGIGHGTYYVAIGAAAIIAIAYAMNIAAMSINQLSRSNIGTLIIGLTALKTILGKDFGYSVLMLISLAILVPILSGLAIPLIATAYGIRLLADSIDIIIKAITRFINAIKPFLLLFTEIDEKLGSSTSLEDKLTRIFNLIVNDASKIHDGIIGIAGSIAVLGASLAALGIGLSFMIPFTFMLIRLIDKLSLVSKFINDLANNSDNINNLLSAIEKHIGSFIALIGSILAIGLFDKGRTFRIMIIGIAQAFMYAARGLVPFGLGIIKVAQGILLLSLAIYVAKNLIGEDIKKLFDTIKSNFNKIADEFGLFIALWNSFSIIILAITSITGITLWLKHIGKNLQSFGHGLISTGFGIIILTLSIKLLASTINGVDPNQLYMIITGIYWFVIILGTLSLILAPVAPLIKTFSSALAVMSVSLLIFAGAMALLIYVTSSLNGDFVQIYNMLGFIIALTSVLGVLTPLLILAGVGTGTLGIGLLILSAALAALVGVINLINNTLGGMSSMWEMIGFISILTGALGMLSVPAFIAGIAIGTLGAGLIVLSAGLLALIGVLAVFGETMSDSEFLQKYVGGLVKFINDWFVGIIRLVLSFFNGVIKYVHNFIIGLKNVLLNGFKVIGFWLPESIREGILNSIDILFSAVENLANGIEETIRNILDIHSESPKFFDIGWWVPESISNGMDFNAEKVVESAKNIGVGIWSTIDKATNGGATKFIENTKNKLVDLKENVFGIFDFDNEDGLFASLANALKGLDFESWINLPDIEFDKVELDDYADQISNVGDAASSTKGTIESLTDTIKNQMKIFERFTFDEDMIDPQELIHNMESQLRGVRNWTTGLDMLTARGISGPLLQYLSEMGPESYKYVEAFLEMTNEEFAYANDLYTESLSVPNEMANKIADDYRELGVEVVDAIKSGGGSAADAAGDVASEGAEKVRQISVAGTWTTLEEIDKLAKDNGPLAMAHYCNEAGKWMDTAEFNEFAAKVQGKMSGVMHLPISDLIRKSGLKQVMAGQMNNMTYELMKRDYGNETGSFYIDGMTRALSASEYLEECHKRGEVIAAYIDTGVNPDYTGKEIGTEIVSSVSKAIDSEESVQQLVTANSNLYKTVDERLSETLMKSGEEAGKNYVAGFTAGFKDEETNKTLLDAINSKSDEWNRFLKEDKLKEQSPSKLTKEYGINYILGFVKGIIDTNNEVENGMNLVGNTAISSLSDTIQAISAQFTDDLDTTPTIRPVLDLDNVYSGMTELDTMFSTAQARVAGKAYVTTHDDSVERLEDAYKKAIMDGNLELANMLLNSEDTNVIVNVTLDTNAEGIFDIVKVENEKETRRSGASPLMIARKNAINAGVIA